jgi:hypothetical protein
MGRCIQTTLLEEDKETTFFVAQQYQNGAEALLADYLSGHPDVAPLCIIPNIQIYTKCSSRSQKVCIADWRSSLLQRWLATLVGLVLLHG